jgi:catalase
VPVNDYHRDGQMRVDDNYGGRIAYMPNSYGEWAEQPEFADLPMPVYGDADRYSQYGPDDDCFHQPGDLYRLMTEDKRAILIDNTTRNIADTTENIKYRHAAHCLLADPEYGSRITSALGLDADKVQELAAMTIPERREATSAKAWGLAE